MLIINIATSKEAAERNRENGRTSRYTVKRRHSLWGNKTIAPL